MIDHRIIPKSPGCYLFKDSSENILYVGKAKDLRKRVASYYTKTGLDEKTRHLVYHAKDLDYFVTDNEVEAIILENNLIKKFQPKYNIDLKDSKKYAYLEITDEKFPRLVLARNPSGTGKFFGPFVSAEARDLIHDALKKAFRLRTCRKMPKRPCLRNHLELCDAPCNGSISRTAYDEKIWAVKMVLKGKTKDLIEKMEKKMKGFSKKERFERAMDLRNQILALERLKERQKMERQRKFDEDIINYTVKDKRVYLMLFNIYKGTLSNKLEFVFDYRKGFLEEFITQYYSENPIPKELILPEKVGAPAVKYLTKIRKGPVKTVIPKIGEKQLLLGLVKKNIELHFFGNLKKTESLQKTLKLNDLPRVIECFDISHISGSSTAGSMVQFRNGRPDKSNYRRFRIRHSKGIDDYSSIAEVVRRRYLRLKKEDTAMPNLIIIDGGKGQLSSALREMRFLDVKIPVISIAKRLDEIHVPGLPFPIRLDRKDQALKFIQEIRDEAHRFAISYNRLLRKKEVLK